MSQIKSLADNSVSTSPTSSNVNVYATGSTAMQVILASGEQVTIAELNGGNPITTSPFNFTYTSGSFPSGVNPIVGSITPSLAKSTLSLGTATSNSIPASWTAVTNATSYNLRRSTSLDGSGSVSVYTGTNLSFNDTGLASNTTYYYFVVSSAVGYNPSTSDIVSKITIAPVTNYELTLVITGTSDPDIEYVVNGEVWPDGKKSFPVGTVIENLVPTIAGYTLSPTSVASTTMDANKTLSFVATATSGFTRTAVIPSDWLELTGGMTATGNGVFGNSRGRSLLRISAGQVGYFEGTGDLAMILDDDEGSLVYFYQARYALKRNNDGEYKRLESYFDNDPVYFDSVVRDTPRRIRLDASNVYFEFSTDNRVTWQTGNTVTRVAGTLWIKVADSDDNDGTNDMHLTNMFYFGFLKS